MSKFIKLTGIYCIVNTYNDKCYVGSAVNIRKRWEFHKWQLKFNKHNNKHLQNAWTKYKQSTFIFTVIEITDLENLIEREQYWIDTLNPEYNICPTAGSPLGREVTIETRLKISISQKGKIIPNEQKAKMSKAKLGVSLSNEHRLKLSLANKGKNKGRKFTHEHKEKLSKAHLGKKLSSEQKIKIGLASSKRGVSDKEKLDERKFGKWPCLEGSRCKCQDCNDKRALYLRNRRKNK